MIRFGLISSYVNLPCDLAHATARRLPNGKDVQMAVTPGRACEVKVLVGLPEKANSLTGLANMPSKAAAVGSRLKSHLLITLPEVPGCHTPCITDSAVDGHSAH